MLCIPHVKQLAFAHRHLVPFALHLGHLPKKYKILALQSTHSFSCLMP